MAPLTINSTVKLNSGYEMPLLGFGVYQTPAKVAEECVTEALKAGYRHIDSAAAYRNEGECATAILSAATDPSLSLPRSSIFFTSKIPPKSRLGYTATKKQVAKSLATTQLGYIDLMLIHAPYGGSSARKGAWKALVEAVEEGKIRSIGISNYGVHHLDELETHIKELEEERGGEGRGGVISVGQWEIHPWMDRDDIVSWCRERKIAVQAYCPVVRGERWGEPVVKKLAEKYGVTEAQVLIRWSLQKGYVPLPKSVTKERIWENSQVYGFELTEEEVEELTTKEYTSVSWDPTVEPLDR